ncbi:MAG TPA: tRNA guanosine(34) transglycosylase Tgt [Gemmatimonadaceae bacterium]|jgi:queuine tRNA-ribosyltransferase
MLSAPPEFSFRSAHGCGSARVGWFTTPHGVVETPAFMPVATHGVVRGLSMDEVRTAGGQMLLANAYHLYLRPGDAMVRALGGLHAFTRWDGPMLTDSGGFQVFSLAKLRTVTEEGVTFRSHLDGSMHAYTPEHVMRIERNIGADVIMQLDELIAGQAELGDSRVAMERSLRWLDRCRAEFERIDRDGRAGVPELDVVHDSAPSQTLFPIVQGGIHAELRRASARGILERGDWAGVAIGGLSVGEAKPDLHAMLEVCDDALPRTVPRYLMGVGFPDDLIEGVRRGIDLFDCVAPTRMGRDGTVFTPDGKVQVLKSSNRTDRRPLVEGCECVCCATYDRAYLRHLFASDEMLGMRLVALHNVAFLNGIMRDARRAMIAGDFGSWSAEWLDRYRA